MKKHKHENVEREELHVYMFQNIKHNISLYVLALIVNHACELFDKCDFPKRTDWNIFVELGSQPT